MCSIYNKRYFDPNKPYKGHDGGQVDSFLAPYYNNTSSNPFEAYTYF